MKLSTKARYGLRAMVDLAQRHGSGPVPLREISERQEVSEQYLEQLFSILRKHGLVRSTRGLKGGYVLAKPPEQITVGEVIRALEGPIAPVDCVSEAEPLDCSRASQCLTRLVWSRLRDSIAEVLDSLTLKEVCQMAHQASEDGYMYYI